VKGCSRRITRWPHCVSSKTTIPATALHHYQGLNFRRCVLVGRLPCCSAARETRGGAPGERWVPGTCEEAAHPRVGDERPLQCLNAAAVCGLGKLQYQGRSFRCLAIRELSLVNLNLSAAVLRTATDAAATSSGVELSD